MKNTPRINNLHCQLLTLLILLSAIFASFSASANFPDKIYNKEIKENFNSSKPYSSASLDYFYFFKVYDMYIWTDAKKWSYEEKFAFQIDYNISASASQIAKRSVKEIQKYYDIDQKEEDKLERTFEKIFPDVKNGDVITGIFEPKNGAEFYHNEQYRGKIENVDIAKMFFDIWLHEDNEFKKASCQLKRKSQSC
jgi:hypothetical protein